MASLTLQTTNLSSWCPSPLPGAHPCPPAPGGQAPSIAALPVLCFPPGSSRGCGVLFNPFPLWQEISWRHSAWLSLGAPHRDVGQGWGLGARCSPCGLGRVRERQRGGFSTPLPLRASPWSLCQMWYNGLGGGGGRGEWDGTGRETGTRQAARGSVPFSIGSQVKSHFCCPRAVSEIISSLAVFTAMSDLRGSFCLAY